MSVWRRSVLGKVCELKRGYDLPKRQRCAGSVPIVSSSGVSGFHNEVKVNGPGVVTGRYGTLGEVFYVECDFWPLNTALYVRDFKGNDPRFIALLLRSMKLGQYDGAAAVPGLNRNQLHTVPVLVPDLATQRVISTVDARFGDLIENSRRRIELLESMARAVYREWFVHFQFPGHKSVGLVDSALGPIPKAWAIVPASQVLSVNPHVKAESGREYPYFSMADLGNRGMACAASSSRRPGSGSKFENGDTLFARITPCLENGKTGYVQVLNSGEIGIGSTEFIVLRGRTVGPAFTYCLARSDPFRAHAIASMSGASGRQRVRNECFDSYLIAEPPRDVAGHFEEAVAPLFEGVEIVRRESTHLSTMRDRLLPKLVSGEIDVSALDVDSVLGEAVA